MAKKWSLFVGDEFANSKVSIRGLYRSQKVDSAGFVRFDGVPAEVPLDFVVHESGIEKYELSSTMISVNASENITSWIPENGFVSLEGSQSIMLPLFILPVLDSVFAIEVEFRPQDVDSQTSILADSLLHYRLGWGDVFSGMRGRILVDDTTSQTDPILEASELWNLNEWHSMLLCLDRKSSRLVGVFNGIAKDTLIVAQSLPFPSTTWRLGGTWYLDSAGHDGFVGEVRKVSWWSGSQCP